MVFREKERKYRCPNCNAIHITVGGRLHFCDKCNKPIKGERMIWDMDVGGWFWIVALISLVIGVVGYLIWSGLK